MQPFGFDFPIVLRNSLLQGPEWPTDKPGPADIVGRPQLTRPLKKQITHQWSDRLRSRLT